MAEPDFTGRYAIAVGNFYGDLADKLVGGAKEEFAKDGISDSEIDVYEVPGAFELPLAAGYAARSGRYDGVACLGAVIRGETDHYDFVCNEAARGIQNVQLETGVPCGFGVLTVDNMDQALARAGGGGKRDSGANAARAVLRMNEIRRELSS
ncbi:MAG: 6,7-dimethyl-8-ribityllumazine synthase [Solirubrobacterales bacterium]|nr:6,7-dimethyl-8-ribityllumazine synthase [Solirubrobacterales bacterium]MCB8914808.1 6,7-dimethyl-8-ribityllumazine synthase [Thermoleophilales bacterium]